MPAYTFQVLGMRQADETWKTRVEWTWSRGDQKAQQERRNRRKNKQAEQQSQGRYTVSWLVDKMQVVAGGGWLHSPLLSSVDVQAYCVAAFTSAFFFLSAQSSYGLDWMCTLSSVLSVFGLMLLALMVFATCTVECSESLMKHCM